jgi:cell pole-organizing protein PopZ
MEEILASIRRILNEDEPVAGAAEAVPEAASDDDVLVLDRSMLVAAPEPFEAMEPETEAAPEAPVRVADPEPPAVQVTQPPSPVAPAAAQPDPALFFGQALVAPETAAATASSVDGLLRTLAASRATQVYRGGPTIEDVVREELRPLLKEWLDENLPPLVERLVRAEIERVVGRAVP